MSKVAQIVQLKDIDIKQLASQLVSYLQKTKNISLKQYASYGLPALVLYLLIQGRLRYSRARYLKNKYPYTRDTFWRMTDHDAWEIQKSILQLEFPFISLKALQFALFRVCIFFPPPTTSIWVQTETEHRPMVSQLYPACWPTQRSFRTPPHLSNDTLTPPS